MSTSCINDKTQTWLESMSESMVELAVTTLGMEESAIRVEGSCDVPPQNKSGAYLAMVSIDESIQIGVVSDKAGCKSISGAMLCMEPEELEELSDPDIADTMGEVVNILAGMVKIKMSESRPNITLGLPIFLDGNIKPNPHQDLGAIKIMVGETETHLVVVRPKE
ncbi:MAG: chemotaxis protein CheX [Planctomycetes bacterium]|nr:chemotaxis protein CheX [Planctomycetota bacterium]